MGSTFHRKHGWNGMSSQPTQMWLGCLFLSPLPTVSCPEQVRPCPTSQCSQVASRPVWVQLRKEGRFCQKQLWPWVSLAACWLAEKRKLWREFFLQTESHEWPSLPCLKLKNAIYFRVCTDKLGYQQLWVQGQHGLLRVLGYLGWHSKNLSWKKKKQKRKLCCVMGGENSR